MPDDDDGGRARARALAQPFGVEEAVDAGKADVEDDGVGHALEDHLLRLDRLAGVAHLDALELERRAHEGAELLVVVDYQDMRLRRHR